MSPTTTPRRDRPKRPTRTIGGSAVVLLTAVTLAGCGSGGTEGAATTAAADTTVAGEVASADVEGSVGADGHWTAAQLCSLVDLATVGALFPGVELVESTGIDDPGWSRCNWDDADIDPLDPASNLFGISGNDHEGQTFSESFEPLDIPGTDQAVFADNLGSDRMSTVLVAVGDQQLTVDFAKDAPGARELAELTAATWAALQVP